MEYTPHLLSCFQIVVENILQLLCGNQCYKEYSANLKLGGLDANHQIIQMILYIFFIEEIK